MNGRSIHSLMALVFGALMLVGGLSVGTSLWTTRTQQHDALILNLAARQRMLSQKMAKEAWLGLLREQDRHYLLQMHNTANQFDEGLQVLMNGGQLTYASTTVTVPPATDPAFRAALEEVQATWEPLHRAAHAVLENEPGSPAFQEGAVQLEQLSDEILEKMDMAVRVYQRAAEARVSRLEWTQLAFLLTGAIVLALGYGVVLTQVLQPVRVLERAVQHMERGRLDTAVPVRVRNELGRLAHAFESMREGIKARMVELRVLAEISRAFREITDREALLAELTASIARLLEAEQCAFVLQEESTGDFVVQWPAYGLTREQVALGRFPAAQVSSMLARIPPEGALIVEDPTREESLAPELIQAWDERSLLIARLQVEDRILGGIRVANKRAGKRFTPEDARLLGLIAGQAAVALERAREHQAVKAAEARYRSLFDGVPVGLYRSTPDGQLLDVNPALVDMLGYPDRESLLKTDLKDTYVDPTERARWRALVEEKGTIRDFELRLRRRDGRTIWVRDNARVVRDADGQVLYYEGSIEDITAHKRAEEALRRRAAHLEALNAIIAAAATASDLPLLLETALQHTLQALEADKGVIWLNPEGEKQPSFPSSLLIAHGLPSEVGEALRDLATAIAATGDGASVAKEAVVGSLSLHLEQEAGLAARWGIRDTLMAPLLAEDHLVGGLIVAASEPRPWGSEEVNLLQAVGRQLGTALERLRLFHETQARADRMACLISLGETLNRPFTLAEVAAAIGQGALALSSADRAAVYLRQSEDTVTCLWSQGLSPEYIAEVTRRARELPGVLMGERPTPLLISDAQSSAGDTLLQSVAKAEGYRGLGLWPLIYEGQVVASVACYFNAPHFWSDGEREVMAAFARQAAVALENARLFEALQTRVRELTALAEVSTALRSAATVQEMAPLLAAQAARLVQADAAFLCLVDEAQQQVVTLGVAGIPHEAVGREHGLEEGITGQVLRSGAIYRFADLSCEPTAVHRDLLAELGPGVCVPLRTTEGQVVGTLLVGRRKPPSGDAPAFRPEEERLLTTLAEIAGNALQRARAHEQLEAAYIETVLALANAMDARDTYTADHSQRLAAWAEATARELGCSDEEIEAVRWGALLHDIGKLGVPDHILQKPGPLDEEEWAIMRQHPEIGARIVAPVRRLAHVAPIIRHHQEHWDGTGYPDGLRGEAIPLGARVLAVVDAYGAMIDDRVYRKARTHAEAVAELRRCAGTQFDPQVVEAFLRVLERGAQPVAEAPDGTGKTELRMAEWLMG